jgi:hypothetical protein
MLVPLTIGKLIDFFSTGAVCPFALWCVELTSIGGLLWLVVPCCCDCFGSHILSWGCLQCWYADSHRSENNANG